jgi:hypothetical protein
MVFLIYTIRVIFYEKKETMSITKVFPVYSILIEVTVISGIHKKFVYLLVVS